MKANIQKQSMNKSNLSKKSTYLILKRTCDILFASIFFIILSPFLLLLNIMLLTVDGSPVIFTQQRVGQDSQLFTIYKYRTMKLSDKKSTPRKYNWTNGVPDDFVFKSASSVQDYTKLGKFLRKTSLDEIWQLLNVIKGDMSIIGPRPEIPEIANHYNEEQRKRLLVKPGITGLAQVKGRSDITHGEKIKFDLLYINECSLGLDLKILFLTIKEVFSKNGAY